MTPSLPPILAPLPAIAQVEATATLLNRMSVVMQIRGRWHARAQGCSTYVHGATPDEAMLNALTAAAASK